MKLICKRTFVGALVATLITAAIPLLAKDKSEDQLIADLSASKEGVVTDALLQLEKKYPTSTKALPKIKELLTDNRLAVKRKAARVLGALHAEVSEDDLKNIASLLKATDEHTIIDALKSLRGLKAASVIPDIVPLLKDTRPNVIRDSCRTLAVLGNKDLIPSIEPLLTHPHPAVQKDAQDAIYQLKAKS